MTTGPSSEAKGGRGGGKGKTPKKEVKGMSSLTSYFNKGSSVSPSSGDKNMAPNSSSPDHNDDGVPREGVATSSATSESNPAAPMEVEGGAEAPSSRASGSTRSRGKPLSNKRDRVASRSNKETSEQQGPTTSAEGETTTQPAQPDEEAGSQKDGDDDDDDDDIEVVEVTAKPAGGGEVIDVDPEETREEEEAAPAPMATDEEDEGNKEQVEQPEEAAASEESEGEKEEGEAVAMMDVETPAAESGAAEVNGTAEATGAATAAPTLSCASSAGSKGKRASKSKKSLGAVQGPETELEKKYREQLEGVLATCSQSKQEDEPDYRLSIDDVLEAARACEPPADGAPAVVPDDLMPVIGRFIQGSHLSLSALSDSILVFLSENLVPCVEDLSREAIQDKIRVIAERKCYGIKPKTAIVAEDLAVEALWTWEVAEASLLPDAAKSIIREVRSERANVGKLIKALAKLMETIRKDPSDAGAISQQETKMFDALRHVDHAKKKREDRLKKQEVKAKIEEEKAKKEEEKAEKARQKEEAKALKKQKKEEKRKRTSAEGAAEEGGGGAAGTANKKKAVEKAPPGVSLFKFFTKKPAESKAPGTPKGSGSGFGAAEDDSVVAMEVQKEDARLTEMDRQIKLGLSHDEVLGLLRDRARESKAMGAARNSKRKPHRFVTLTVTVTKRAGDGIWDGPDYAELEEKRLWNCMKFFKFAEDIRPPYFGTWSKRTRSVSGRRPFGQDRRLLDYDYDSEEDWEEGDADEDGENLSVTAMDDEKDPDDGLDYNDGWLARDNDLGLSDDEEREEGAGGANAEDKELVRYGTIFFDAEFNSDKPIVDERIRSTWEPLRVRVLQEVVPIKLSWSDGEEAATAKPDEAVPTPMDGAAAPADAAAKPAGSRKSTGGRAARTVPAEQMPALIKMVDKSKMGIEKLAELFVAEHPGPSKAQVYSKIKDITVKQKTLKGGSCLIVRRAVLEEYGLEVPTEEGEEVGGAAKEAPAAATVEHVAPLAEEQSNKKKAKITSPAPPKGQKSIGVFFRSDGEAATKTGRKEAGEAMGVDETEVATGNGTGSSEEPIVIDDAAPDQPKRAFRGDDASGWEETKVLRDR